MAIGGAESSRISDTRLLEQLRRSLSLTVLSPILRQVEARVRVAVPQQGLGGGVGHEPFEWAIAQLARQSDQLEEQLLRPSSRIRKRRSDAAREPGVVDLVDVLGRRGARPRGAKLDARAAQAFPPHADVEHGETPRPTPRLGY